MPLVCELSMVTPQVLRAELHMYATLSGSCQHEQCLHKRTRTCTHVCTHTCVHTQYHTHGRTTGSRPKSTRATQMAMRLGKAAACAFHVSQLQSSMPSAGVLTPSHGH